MTPRLVGSLAKDTHLARPLDVDVFILFPKETARDVLEREGLAMGRAVVPQPVLKYAEHPYVHGVVDGFEVDVVPAYRLRSAAGRLSAVDRTPFHTAFVKRRATPRHRAEIRLFKQWLRGVRCYGAETATGGVSGYLAELLVLRHGTFDRTLTAMARWRAPVELALDGPAAPMGGPLVFIDPVDASRNAAAAVTPRTFERLVRAARAYAQRPHRDFFFPPEPRPDPPERLATLLARHPTVGLESPRPAGRPETALPQAHRLLGKLRRALEEEGFRVPRADVHEVGDNRLLFLIEHDPAQLPATFVHEGPREADADHVQRFLRKWEGRPEVVSGPERRGQRWSVVVRRTPRAPRDILAQRLERILAGVALEPGERAIQAGPSLVASERRLLALTLFLRRLEPWQYGRAQGRRNATRF